MSDQDLDRFWEACGARPPLRLTIQGRDSDVPDSVRSFARPFVLIGRDPRNDLVLDHPQVSRRHAYIQVLGGQPFCFDLDSRTAISWSGALRRSGWMEPNRPVQLGQFQLGSPPDSSTALARLPSDLHQAGRSLRPDPLNSPLESSHAPFPLVLERVDPLGTATQWPIERALTLVGRSPDSGLKLSDLSVSRFHCALIRLQDEVWIVDLLGRDGTRVNEEPIRWARLERGDHIQIGRFHLVVKRRPLEIEHSAESIQPELIDVPVPHRELPRQTLRIAPTPLDYEPYRSSPAPVRLKPAPLPPQPQPRPSLAPAAFPPVEPLSPTLPTSVHSPSSELLPETIRYAEALITPILNQMSMMQQQMFEQYHQSMMSMMHLFGKLHQDQKEVLDRELEEIQRITREVRDIQQALTQPSAPAAPSQPSSPNLAEPRNAALFQATESRPPIRESVRPKPGPEPAAPSEGDYRLAQQRLLERMSTLQQERQSRWQGLLGRLMGAREDD